MTALIFKLKIEQMHCYSVISVVITTKPVKHCIERSSELHKEFFSTLLLVNEDVSE